MIRAEGEIEMMALNSWESFQNNKNFYRDRIETEDLPAVRKLLLLDCDHLDEMQGKLSTAREFYFVIRIHFLCGNTWRCVWALREYPIQTEEQALLRHLGEKNGVSLHIYARRLSLIEENKVFDNATSKNRMNSNTSTDLRQAMAAESNLKDIVRISEAMRKSGEPLVCCAVFIELVAQDAAELKKLQGEVLAELMRSKLNVDRLTLRQQQGFRCVCPGGYNVFSLGGLTNVAKNVKAAILFNILSYMSNMLLSEGNAVAALDELYIWLDNPTAVEYIRNCLKRVRKRNSALLMASQNLEDFDQPNIREMTKPLFSIPPHQFLFNAGTIDKKAYMDMLQLEESEYELIRFPHRGLCLYKCGNERYLLEVTTPPYKQELFGEEGGK